MSVQAKAMLVADAVRGIGLDIAEQLAPDSEELVLVCIQVDKFAAACEEAEPFGRHATSFIANVSRRDAPYAVVDHAEDALHGLDLPLRNFGVALSSSDTNHTIGQSILTGADTIHLPLIS